MPITETGIPYRIRESKRAKRVIIKVWPSAEVEVVIPEGYKKGRLDKLIESHREWINQKVKGFRLSRKIHRPRSINLRALEQRWSIRYDSKAVVDRLTVIENKAFQLTVLGNIETTEAINQVLNEWVNRKAKQFLQCVLGELGKKLGITYNRVTIRRQKTVWGSCSGKKNINLNQNLMFLPIPMARHTLVHELCHIRQMNHSSKFWALLERYIPDSKEIRAKFKEANRMVPDWARW